MDGAIVAIFRVEAEKAELRLTRSGTWIEEDRRNVELALKLRLDGADPEIWVEGLPIGHQDDGVAALVQTPKQRHDFIAGGGVEVARGFVGEKNGRMIHQRPRNQSVLRAIESLAQALGMSIIAEGVETFEELTYLRAATRIRYAQGFYFSKPLYLDELTNTRSGDASGRTLEVAREPSERRGSHPFRTVARSRSA